MGDGRPEFDNVNPEDWNNDPQGDDFQLPDDIDPMAWLEKLASRQGATEGFTTNYEGIEVEDIDPDSVILDEPGYTPYETFGGSTQPQKAVQQPADETPAYDESYTEQYQQQAYDQQQYQAHDQQQAYDPAQYPETSYDQQPAYDPAQYPEASYDQQPAYDPAQYPEASYDQQPAYDPAQYPEASYDQQPAYDPAQYPEASYDQQPAYDPAQYPEASYDQQQAYQQPQEEPADLGFDGIPDGVDPMAWLEKLASRQGATEGFTTHYEDIDVQDVDPDSVVLDEPGYIPYGESAPQALPEEPAYEPPPAEEEAVYDQQYDYQAPQDYYEPPAQEPIYEQQPEAYAAEDGIPPGVDPLAWLEKLASRQGATEGFTTDYSGIDVQDVDPDSVVIDEPGYIPYGESAPQALPEEPADFLQELSDESGMGMDVDFGEPVEAVAPSDTESFLNSLSGDVESVPDFADEWGAPEPALDAPPSEDTEAFLASLTDTDPEMVFDEPADSAADLSWLDELGAEVGEDTIELSEVVDVADTLDEQEAIDATHTPDEVMASIDGMSDEELMALQARGELSGEQELAWLQRQAMKLHEARQAAEDEEAIPFEELPPAEANADLPDWMQEVQVIEDQEVAFLQSLSDTDDVFLDDIEPPAPPDDMPSWLRQEPLSATGEFDIPDFTLEDATLSMEDESATPASVGEPIGAGLNLDDYDPALDDWAEALDEEHDRLQAGVQEDPSWLREARDQVGFEPLSAPPETEPEPAPITEPEAPAYDEMPDWLQEATRENTVASDDLPDDLPDWLRPVAAESEADGNFDDIGTWLREEESGGRGEMVTSAPATEPLSEPTPQPEPTPSAALSVPDTAEEYLPAAEATDLPSWVAREETIVAAAPEPPAKPSPQPVRAAPAPARPVQAPPKPQAPPVQKAPPPRTRYVASNEPVPQAGSPAPVPVVFDAFKAKLDANPEDHSTRLELARAIAQSGDVAESVPQYETLVDQMGEIENVAEDLKALIPTNPAVPALRRLLGDVYMRQGYLQEALDAYRGALDNL